MNSKPQTMVVSEYILGFCVSLLSKIACAQLIDESCLYRKANVNK